MLEKVSENQFTNMTDDTVMNFTIVACSGETEQNLSSDIYLMTYLSLFYLF